MSPSKILKSSSQADTIQKTLLRPPKTGAREKISEDSKVAAKFFVQATNLRRILILQKKRSKSVVIFLLYQSQQQWFKAVSVNSFLMKKNFQVSPTSRQR